MQTNFIDCSTNFVRIDTKFDQMVQRSGKKTNIYSYLTIMDKSINLINILR